MRSMWGFQDRPQEISTPKYFAPQTTTEHIQTFSKYSYNNAKPDILAMQLLNLKINNPKPFQNTSTIPKKHLITSNIIPLQNTPNLLINIPNHTTCISHSNHLKHSYKLSHKDSTYNGCIHTCVWVSYGFFLDNPICYVYTHTDPI